MITYGKLLQRYKLLIILFSF